MAWSRERVREWARSVLEVPAAKAALISLTGSQLVEGSLSDLEDALVAAGLHDKWATVIAQACAYKRWAEVAASGAAVGPAASPPGGACGALCAAFVVGVASYPAPLSLPACIVDAEDVASTLTTGGYSVTKCIDPGDGSLKADFLRFATSLHPGTCVVLYFSGHGVQRGGANYLVPADAIQLGHSRESGTQYWHRCPAESEQQALPYTVLWGPCLALDWMIQEVQQRLCGDGAVIVILDACRNEEGLSVSSVAGQGPDSGPAAAFVVAYASGTGLQAYHLHESRNSCFTGVLLEEVKRAGHTETVLQLLGHVRARVERMTTGLGWTTPQIPCCTQSLGPRPLYLVQTLSNVVVCDADPWHTLGVVLRPLVDSLQEKLREQEAERALYIPSLVVDEAPGLQPGSQVTVGSGVGLDTGSSVLDLPAALTAFLASDQQTMLLLGEPGCGKSLGMLWYANELLQAMSQALTRPLSGSSRTDSLPWLPVMIDLKLLSADSLPGQLQRQLDSLYKPLSDGASLFSALMDSVDPSVCRGSRVRLLVMCDGLDELQGGVGGMTDSFLTALCRGLQCSHASAVLKVVVTSRETAISSRSAERALFGDCARRVLRPFNDDQIRCYLTKVVRAPEFPSGEQAEPASSSAHDVPGVTLEDYMSVMTASPSLQEITRNPFVLKLFVEVLPSLSQEDRGSLSRYKIYNRFVELWLHRSLRRLEGKLEAGRAWTSSLGVTEEQSLQGFELAAALLAGEMHRDNVLAIPMADVAHTVEGGVNDVDEDRRVDPPWVRALEATYCKLNERRRAELESRLPKRRRPWDGDKIAADASHFARAHIDEVAAACPLRCSGGYLQFVHKSFWEYFCAQQVLICAGYGDDLEARIQTASQALTTLGRPIQLEPGVLDFLIDFWKEPSRERDAVKECLIGVIRRSRDVAEAPLATGGDSVASSLGELCSAPPAAPPSRAGCCGGNAATILNRMGEPLTHLVLDGAVLDGADLSFAKLCGTSLQGASMVGCCLEKAGLKGVDMSNARLDGVQLRERAPVPVVKDIRAVVWDLSASDCSKVIVVSGTDCQVWDVDVGRPVDQGKAPDSRPEFVYLRDDNSTQTLRCLRSGSHEWSPIIVVGHVHGARSTPDIDFFRAIIATFGCSSTGSVMVATPGGIRSHRRYGPGFSVSKVDVDGHAVAQSFVTWKTRTSNASSVVSSVSSLLFGPWKLLIKAAETTDDWVVEVVQLVQYPADRRSDIDPSRAEAEPECSLHSSRVLASGHVDGKVCIWDPDSMTCVWQRMLPCKRGVSCLAFSSGDPVFLVAGSEAGSLCCWDSEGLTLGKWQAPGNPGSEALTCATCTTPGERQVVACGTKSGSIFLRSLPSLHHLGSLSGGIEPITCLAFCPVFVGGCATLASGHRGGVLRVWDDVLGLSSPASRDSWIAGAAASHMALECSELLLSGSQGLTDHQLALLACASSLSAAEMLSKRVDCRVDPTSVLFSLCASRRANGAAVDHLLRSGANADHQRADRATPIMLACWSGADEATVSLAKAISLENFGCSEPPALHRVCRHGCVEAVDGNCPLVIASREGHSKVVEALLEAGAAVYNTRRFGKLGRALGIATRSCFVHHEARSATHCPLQIAACEGHVKVVETLLQAGASRADQEFNTVALVGSLALAAERGHVSIVQLLLRHGIHPDVARVEGRPLLLAACRKRSEESQIGTSKKSGCLGQDPLRGWG